MSNQESYRQFAASMPDMPLFMQPWYLDAVCHDGVWDATLVEKGGRIVAVLPYFLKQKFFWNYVAMPRLCKFMGPYLLPEYRNLNAETRLYEALLEKLPKHLAAFEQDTNYLLTNWLPFFWRGFRQSTRYSYTLNLELPEDALFHHISKAYRKKIERAGQYLQIRNDLPLQELLRLIGLSFARQGLSMPYSTAFMEGLYAALSAHDSCRLFFAVDPETGSTHSAALLVWDGQSAYYLASGDDPELRHSGSALLLKWEAVRFSKNSLQVPVFDFEGSMIRAIEIGRRDFGAQQRPYFRLQKEWSWLWRLGKFIRQR